MIGALEREDAGWRGKDSGWSLVLDGAGTGTAPMLPARWKNASSVSTVAAVGLSLRSEMSPYVRSVSSGNPAMPGRVGAARLPAPPRHSGVSLALQASVQPSPDVHGRVSFGGTVPRTSNGDWK